MESNNKIEAAIKKISELLSITENKGDGLLSGNAYNATQKFRPEPKVIIFAQNSGKMNETKKVSRRKYTAEFKAKVALEAMQENQTLPELCSKYQLSPNQVNQWKKRLRERSAEAFRADTNGRDEKDRLIEQLYKTIGELTMDVEFLKKKLFP